MKEFLKSLKIAFLFIGTIVGAGFASGKELLSFFGGHAIYLLPLCVIVFALFFYTAWLFMRIGQIVRPNSFSDITKTVFGRGGVVMDVFMIISYFIIFSAMLAGIESLAREGLGISLPFPFFSLGTLILGIVVALVGIEGIVKANSVLVPIIIVFILGVTISSIVGTGITVKTPKSVASAIDITYVIVNCLLYVSMNMLLSGSVLASGSMNVSKKVATGSSGIGSVIIAITIMLILGCIFLLGGDVINQDMPMLYVANQFGSYIRILSTIIIWCGVFTTLISSIYPVVEFCDAHFKRRAICVPIIAVIGFSVSLLGFGFIVNMLLPIMGAVGLFFIISCSIYYFKTNRQNKKYKKNENIV